VARAVSSELAQEREEQEQAKPAPSGRLLLRMPGALHAELTRAAERDGVSLNQFITKALARTIGWNGDGEASSAEAAQPDAGRSSRLVIGLLLANVVVIGLTAIAAIAILLLAWLG
jgi:hypothetical protein